MRKVLVCLLVGCLIVVAVLAHSPTPAAQTGPQTPPAFKSAVNAITLDVRVVDAEGRFVSNLSKDDFQIFEDGKAQAITAFDSVNIPIHADERPLFAGQPVDSDVASNVVPVVPGSNTPAGRLYVLLMDDTHTNPGRSSIVRAQARDFIEHHFTESDRAVVVTTSGRVKIAQEFTNNRKRLLDAIDRFQGGFDTSAECGMVVQPDWSVKNIGCGCHDDNASLREVTAMAEWLAPLAGQRKAVLFFGEGLSGETLGALASTGAIPTEAASGSGSDPQAEAQDVAVVVAGIECGLVPTNRKEAAAEAARANVTIYPLDPRRNESDALTRIVSDTSSYYLLGYVPTNEKRDGTFRKVEVRTTRPGLVVQARAGYTAQNDAPPRKAPRDISPALTELMSSPVSASGLTMSVAAPVFLGNRSKASVELIVDISGRDLTATSNSSSGKGSLELLAAVADADGHVKTSEHGSLALNLSPSTRTAVTEHGLRVLSRLDVPPGRYLLRVAGVDGDGQTRGSVQYDLDVPDFSSAALTMSSLTLAAASELARPTTGSDKAWTQRFPEPPTTLRVFSTSDEISITGEIYSVNRPAHAIEVTTMIASRAGDVPFRHAEQLTASPGPTATFRHHTAISLQPLVPGEYLLTVAAKDPTLPSAAVSRQVPFNVR